MKRYLTILLALMLAVPSTLLMIIYVSKASGGAWYVSRSGDGTSGTSWATAWQNTTAINWASVSAGDTVYLDGGPAQMVFTGTLVPKSGTTVMLSQEAGHNGQAVLFGGRSLPLPNCDTASYTLQPAALIGVDFGNASGAVVDGTKWRGIVVYGYNLNGASFSSSSSNDTLRYVELYDNGKAVLNAPSNGWRPDQPGIHAAGTGILIDHALVHDNGQDALQSGGGVNGITISNSWLYNARTNPTNPSLAYNFCMHSDGFQIYDGGVQGPITFQGDIIGPGMMQGTILGQTKPDGITMQAQVDNVSFSNVLILDTTNSNIMGYDKVPEHNWGIDHVTSFHVLYDPDNGTHHALLLRGAEHQLTNSIFYGGDCYVPDGLATSGDYKFNTLNGSCYGTTADPQFVNAPAYTSQPSIATLIAGDYTTQNPAMAGKGSTLTRVCQLLGNCGGASPTPTLTSTTTPSRTNTPTAVSTATPTNTQTNVPTDTPTPTDTYTPTVTDTPTETLTPTPIPITCYWYWDDHIYCPGH